MFYSKLCFSFDLEIDIEKIFRSTNVCKAAGIDDLSGCFLKDDSRVSSKPISEMYNISIKLGYFPDSCKKFLYKKGIKLALQIAGYYRCYL